MDVTSVAQVIPRTFQGACDLSFLGHIHTYIARPASPGGDVPFRLEYDDMLLMLSNEQASHGARAQGRKF